MRQRGKRTPVWEKRNEDVGPGYSYTVPSSFEQPTRRTKNGEVSTVGFGHLKRFSDGCFPADIPGPGSYTPANEAFGNHNSSNEALNRSNDGFGSGVTRRASFVNPHMDRARQPGPGAYTSDHSNFDLEGDGGTNQVKVSVRKVGTTRRNGKSLGTSQRFRNPEPAPGPGSYAAPSHFTDIAQRSLRRGHTLPHHRPPQENRRDVLRGSSSTGRLQFAVAESPGPGTYSVPEVDLPPPPPVSQGRGRGGRAGGGGATRTPKPQKVTASFGGSARFASAATGTPGPGQYVDNPRRQRLEHQRSRPPPPPGSYGRSGSSRPLFGSAGREVDLANEPGPGAYENGAGGRRGGQNRNGAPVTPRGGFGGSTPRFNGPASCTPGPGAYAAEKAQDFIRLYGELD